MTVWVDDDFLKFCWVFHNKHTSLSVLFSSNQTSYCRCCQPKAACYYGQKASKYSAPYLPFELTLLPVFRAKKSVLYTSNDQIIEMLFSGQCSFHHSLTLHDINIAFARTYHAHITQTLRCREIIHNCFFCPLPLTSCSPLSFFLLTPLLYFALYFSFLPAHIVHVSSGKWLLIDSTFKKKWGKKEKNAKKLL